VDVLCSFVGGAGHLTPQVPLLRALSAAGHDLTLIGRSSGIRAAPTEVFRRIIAKADRRLAVRDEISALRPVDRDAELNVVADHFAGDAARRSAEAIENLLASTSLIVCDELDFGAMASGARAGIPVAVVSVIASGALVRAARVSDALERLRLELGLTGPMAYQGDRFVIPFAPRMRNPRFPPPANAIWMRPDRGAEPTPDGSIVATLGTEFNTESGDLLERILAALNKLDAPAVLAVGRDLDPARFGPHSSNVRIEQYVDLDTLIPRASVVVHHGGSGLFTKSVVGGAAQLVLPMGADQPFTADCIERLGVGTALDSKTALPAEIAAHVMALRDSAETRDHVRTLRAESLTLPPPAAAVVELEALVATPLREHPHTVS
jgi:UDP:flavonoid glycosyltransferase YjiC (YdhE family)